MDGFLQVEFSILDWITTHLHTAFLDAFMPWFSSLSNHGEMWIALAMVLLFIPKDQAKGVQVILALILSFIVCNLLLKNLVARVRPYDLLAGIELLVNTPHDYSFPSGHTSSAFAAATVLMLLRWRWRYITLGAAILMAFSRLYLYVHFPTDVLGGVVVGLAVGYLAVKIYGLIYGSSGSGSGTRLER